MSVMSLQKVVSISKHSDEMVLSLSSGIHLSCMTVFVQLDPYYTPLIAGPVFGYCEAYCHYVVFKRFRWAPDD